MPAEVSPGQFLQWDCELDQDPSPELPELTVRVREILDVLNRLLDASCPAQLAAPPT